ncbi:MAG: hypothetical protein DRQ62_13625 [Gammaproteobacteria bacterium]|nr:MAG: hypothetical protein DRQ62_13625 [Gammaproteobacteria bacterium]
MRSIELITSQIRHLRTISTGLLVLFSTAGLHAQTTVPATGGDASGSGGSVAYSIGQVVYTTNTGATGTVSQGVQQTYEIIPIGTMETELNISLSIFPNPTSDNLTLEIKDHNIEKLSYQLLDTQGKLLGSEEITASQTQINMSALSNGPYFIKVIQENKIVRSFKVIKNE